jgi:hypothetical protein
MMAASVFYIPAQTNNTDNTDNTSGAFDTSDFPQWAKDLRRWEIVAFGSLPFTMFYTTFTMDMRRWNDANGMSMSEAGRRYAPWPLKSAGAVLMDSGEFVQALKTAAYISVGIAFTDLIIVKIKRYKARKKAEALPASTIIINRTPWPEEAPADQEDNDTEKDAAGPGTPGQPVPERP